MWEQHLTVHKLVKPYANTPWKWWEQIKKVCGSEVTVKGKRVYSAQSAGQGAMHSAVVRPVSEVLRSPSPMSSEEEDVVVVGSSSIVSSLNLEPHIC